MTFKFKISGVREVAVDCGTNGTLSKNKAESTITQNCKQQSSAHLHIDQSSVVVVGVDNAGNYAGESSENVKPYIGKVLHDYDAQDDDELSLKKGISEFTLFFIINSSFFSRLGFAKELR